MIYIYSDPHFGHRRMAEEFTIKTPEGEEVKARPFATVQEMDQTLLQRYREVVSPDDVVWWLGDVCFKPTEALMDSIAALPGTRHLILGNHDRENMGRYVRMGFNKIRSSWQTEGMLFTHIPVHPQGLGTRRGQQMINVHGHSHSNHYPGPYVNVCVEQTDYRPLPWEKVLHLVERKRKEQADAGT